MPTTAEINIDFWLTTLRSSICSNFRSWKFSSLVVGQLVHPLGSADGSAVIQADGEDTAGVLFAVLQCSPTLNLKSTFSLVHHSQSLQGFTRMLFLWRPSYCLRNKIIY